ncbi:hypothetical protein Tco_0636473, partial [Tanacetum coccineum]
PQRSQGEEFLLLHRHDGHPSNYEQNDRLSHEEMPKESDPLATQQSRQQQRRVYWD